MEPRKLISSLGLTFDDVLLLPGYADFVRSDIDLSTNLTRNIKLSLPLISSPMDTVTEAKLAIELARLGGIGIIHRNLSINEQAAEASKVKKKKLLAGAAIGVGFGLEERAKALVLSGVDVLVVDSAHGFAKPIITAVEFIKTKYPKIQVIAGNIATVDGARVLIKAGADGLRVGMGPAAICTTRVISGMGVPQITAITDVCKVAKKSNIPVIADGGIKYSGDIVKALAAGASTVMIGRIYAQSEEAPGKVVRLSKIQVPERFKNVLNGKQLVYKFKSYRGMGSVASMKRGARIKLEDEFHGKDYKDRVLVAEGVEGLVPIKGGLREIVEQQIGGIKSGMYYIGAKNIRQLWHKAEFIQITQASLTESHPHEIFITNPGNNYK
ncbi:MAG: IMP dehydrogenase [Candidatus Levyibacteriota bacterium]